ncbi:hypothetical protein BC834DRAFT_528711 [Gloeopeniophorella convolvens]|nr:hypothetical protein BC834DRAFT_528711 [Gloeopeniophorella convolvens]
MSDPAIAHSLTATDPAPSKSYNAQLAEATQKGLQRMCAMYPPMKAISKEYYRLKVNQRAPRLLWFGIGITRSDLVSYAKKHGFWLEDEDFDLHDKLMWADFHATKRLREVTTWKHLELRCPWSLEYSCLVGVYSSYRVLEWVLEPRDERWLMCKIRKEFDLPKDRKPIWYFDQEAYDHEYLEMFSRRHKEIAIEQKAQVAAASRNITVVRPESQTDQTPSVVAEDTPAAVAQHDNDQ